MLPMSRRPTNFPRTLLLIAALFVTPFMTPLAAATIRGRVVDPQGHPIAGTTVDLHRGDAKIAEARTDSRASSPSRWNRARTSSRTPR